MPRTVLGVTTKIYVLREQSFNDLVRIERINFRDRLLSDTMVLSIPRHIIALILPFIGYYHLVCTVDPSWSLWKHSVSFRGNCRCWGVSHVCTSNRSTYWQEEGDGNLTAALDEKTLLV